MRDTMEAAGKPGIWGVMLEWVVMLIAAGLMGIVFWLFLVVTPDQASGEAELERAQPGVEVDAAR